MNPNPTETLATLDAARTTLRIAKSNVMSAHAELTDAGRLQRLYAGASLTDPGALDDLANATDAVAAAQRAYDLALIIANEAESNVAKAQLDHETAERLAATVPFHRTAKRLAEVAREIEMKSGEVADLANEAAQLERTLFRTAHLNLGIAQLGPIASIRDKMKSALSAMYAGDGKFTPAYGIAQTTDRVIHNITVREEFPKANAR